MKKSVTLIALILTLCGSGWFVYKRFFHHQIVVAQILPAQTLFVAEIPNVPRSLLRWNETALKKIASEQEVKAFVERSLSKIPQNSEWKTFVDQMLGIAPVQAFEGITDVKENMPSVIGGFAFHGKRAALDSFITHWRTKAQSASPTSKLDLQKYGQFEIESLTDNGITVVGAVARDWYFIANDLELLKATLDRFSKASKETLAETDFYKKTMAELPEDPEFRIFWKPTPLLERVMSLMAATGQPVLKKDADELKKISGVGFSTRFEGGQIRDSLFVYQPGKEKEPEITQRTLILTGTSTLFYAASAPKVPKQLPPEVSGAAISSLGEVATFIKQLGLQGFTLADVDSALGGEFAIFADWPANSLQPLLGVSGQVKELALARKLFNAAFADWPTEEIHGTQVWTTPQKGFSFNPVIALGEGFYALSFSKEAVQDILTRSKTTHVTLEQAQNYAEVSAKLQKPETLLIYLDTKAAFERFYGALRPMAMIGLAFVPRANEYVDTTKLPAIDTIAKHLSPFLVSGSQTGDGTLLESYGPFTLSQVTLGIGAGAAAVAMPILQGQIKLPDVSDVQSLLSTGGFNKSSTPPPPAATPAPVTTETPSGTPADPELPAQTPAAPVSGSVGE